MPVVLASHGAQYIGTLLLVVVLPILILAGWFFREILRPPRNQ